VRPVALGAALCLAGLASGCLIPKILALTDFYVTIAPLAVSAPPGGSFNIDVTVQYEINDSPAVAVVGLYLQLPGGSAFPNGVATFASPASPPSCSTGSTTSSNPNTCTFTINVGASAPPGTYELVVRGWFDGPSVIDDSNTLDLTVLMPPPPFSLQVAGGDTLPAGGQLPLTVTVVRDPGFNGAVDLGIGQPLTPTLPPGITAAFSVDPVPPGTTQSILTLSNNGATVGDHALVISGIGGGATVKVDYSVTVPPPVNPSGWKEVQATAVPLLDVDVPTAAVGYTVGNDGASSIAFKSTDGGATWSNLAVTGGAGVLTRVQFLDATTGYLAGENSTLLKTTDGGATWTNAGATIPIVLDIRAMHFLDGMQGFVGGGGNSTGRPAAVYRTADGGATWTLVAGPWTAHVNNTIRAIRFVSATDGFVSHDAVSAIPPVHHTSDGGLTWTAGTGTVATFLNALATAAVAGTAEVFGRAGTTWSSLGMVAASTPPALRGVGSDGAALWVVGVRSVGGSGVAVVAKQVGGGWMLDFDGFAGGLGGNHVGGLSDVVMFNATEGVAVGSNSIIRRFP
jgi:photosystem II stability/assembly factor-like uncharacterized protein